MLTRLRTHLYDKSGTYKLGILFSPLFVGGLVAKLYAAALFGGVNFTTLFVPFVSYFATTGSDPYTYFYTLGLTEAFPYPALMLWLLALSGFIFSPLLPVDPFFVTHRELLIFHLPILLADITILVILSRWLKHHHRTLLWLYWLSPVLFYINYIHSQLDAIPIAFTFAFLYFLFKERWLIALVILGAAVATKFHIAILLPFTLIYMWRRRVSLPSIAAYALASVGTFVSINSWYLLSPAFQTIVFNNREQLKIFDLQITLGSEHIIYLIPLAYCLLLLHSLTFRRLNRDTFVMFLGFAFGLLTLGIPPMQGWYYWILPFIIYFYCKKSTASRIPLHLLTLAYFVYFALIESSDYLSVFSTLWPALATVPNLYTLFATQQLPAELIKNLAFTVLQALLFMNVLWLYQRGVEESKKQKLYNMPYLVGIAGDSGSGKSTLSQLLIQIFGSPHVAVVAGDAMHRWERGNAKWQTFTHLDPKANHLHEDISNLTSLQNGNDVFRREYDHHTGTFTTPHRLASKTVVLFEGLHTLFLSKMRSGLDLRIFIQPEENLRIHWKLRRDTIERGYSKERVMAQLSARAKDAETYISVQEKYADITFSLKSLTPLTDELMGTDMMPPVYLEVTCDNTVHLEPLISHLAAYVHVEHVVTDSKQIVSVTGTVSKNVIEHLSYTLTPELTDITTTDPVWADDHAGIMQLILVYYILETLPHERQPIPIKQPRAITPLADIAYAAQQAGSNYAYVQGGGGNVSIKTDNATMAVKASGLRLEEIEETTGLVGVDYQTVRRFFNVPRNPQEKLAETAAYEAVVAASRLSLPGIPDTALRPSIETGFHAILDTAVIHTHSVYVNILTCSVEGALILHKLFPHAAFIPYETPGVTLTSAISQALKQHPHHTFFLENHGVIVTGDTAKEALLRHEAVNRKIVKWLTNAPPFPLTTVRTTTDGQLITDESTFISLVTTHAALIPRFKETILFPDQVVYGASFGLAGEDKPITIDLATGCVTYTVTYKEAQAFAETFAAWLYIMVGMTLRGLTPKTISTSEGAFIANLDSEKYRKNIVS